MAIQPAKESFTAKLTSPLLALLSRQEVVTAVERGSGHGWAESVLLWMCVTSRTGMSSWKASWM